MNANNKIKFINALDNMRKDIIKKHGNVSIIFDNTPRIKNIGNKSPNYITVRSLNYWLEVDIIHKPCSIQYVGYIETYNLFKSLLTIDLFDTISIHNTYLQTFHPATF
jgi:hypothetical protein